jgi:hypothetical protein
VTTAGAAPESGIAQSLDLPVHLLLSPLYPLVLPVDAGEQKDVDNEQEDAEKDSERDG